MIGLKPPFEVAGGRSLIFDPNRQRKKTVYVRTLGVRAPSLLTSKK